MIYYIYYIKIIFQLLKNIQALKVLKFLLFLYNILFLIINLILILHKQKLYYEIKNILNKKKIDYIFKSSDYYLINFSAQTFNEIYNYLNSKYIYYKNNIIKDKIFQSFKKREFKKKIFLYSVDLFNEKLHKKWIKNKLKDKFVIKFDSEKPDYLLYNVFGNEHLNRKYNNAIKIAIFTENQIPNLNEADYAIGHAHIIYLDRYFKFPLFLWNNINSIKKSREKVLNSPIRTKFCAAIISNNISTDGFRFKFINELNKYKKIDMGGKYQNNVGGPIKNKIEFLSSYKFSIAMENSEGDGYLSEKIVDSLISGTIPIYYGDYMIDEYINPRVYILIKNEKKIKEKIEYIKEINENDELYINILKEKVLIDENISNEIQQEEKKFLHHIFEQEKIKAKRISN